MKPISCHKQISCLRKVLKSLLEVALSFPQLSFVLFLAIGSVGLVKAHQEQQQYNALYASMRDVQVSVNLARPSPTQESIDLAMQIYSIDIDANVKWPIFDAGLIDRGLTTGGTISQKKSVNLGAAAFTSWAVLGSTLGHEVEIHCKQSFASIMFVDSISSLHHSAKSFFSSHKANAATSYSEEISTEFGTWNAERVAYKYEIGSKGRFGLSSQEVESINQVMNYYYPESK